MKFKFNYLENKLWRLKGEYAYEISEENHFHTQQETYGTDSFCLGDNHWIIFTWKANQVKVFYKEKGIIYQKILALSNTGEIIIEFSEENKV